MRLKDLACAYHPLIVKYPVGFHKHTDLTHHGDVLSRAEIQEAGGLAFIGAMQSTSGVVVERDIPITVQHQEPDAQIIFLHANSAAAEVVHAEIRAAGLTREEPIYIDSL